MKRALTPVALAALSLGLIGLRPAGAQTTNPGTINAQKVGTIYTHDGAELLYRQAKYAQAETMSTVAVEPAGTNRMPGAVFHVHTAGR